MSVPSFVFFIVCFLFTVISGDMFQEVTTQGCQMVKGCLYTPVGCTGDDCLLLATWKFVTHPSVSEGYIEFELLGKADRTDYLTMSFSEDHAVGDDGFVGCFIPYGSSEYQVRTGYNDKRTNEYAFSMGSDKELLVTEGDDLGGVYFPLSRTLQCRFRRRVKPLYSATQLKDLSLPNEYYLIVSRGSEVRTKAFGPALAAGQILTTKKIKVTSRNVINNILRPSSSAGTDPNQFDIIPVTGSMTHMKDGPSTLMKAHGCLMVLAWVMCASIGLILSKYYKDIWPNALLLHQPTWFQSHRILQALCVLLTCIAIILALIYCNGYSGATAYPFYVHPILGFIVFSLALLNSFVSLCRCSDKSPHRPWYNWTHFFIGTFAHVLSVPTMMLGLRMPAAGTGLLIIDYPMYILVLFIIFQFFVELSLEIHGCIYYDKNRRRMIDFRNDPYNQKRALQDAPIPEPAGRKFKHFMIGFHATIASLVAVVLVIIIAVN